MKFDELKDGDVLVLTRDVANPRPDRRKTRSFEALVKWKAGTTLLYRKTRNGGSHVEARGMYGIMNHYDDGYGALVEACEKAPRTLGNTLFSAKESGAYITPHEILEAFLAQGKLTLDDIDAAIVYAAEHPTDEE